MSRITLFIKKNVQIIVKLIIGIMAVFYLLVSLNFSSIYNSLSGSNKWFISSALLLLPLNICIQYLKWHLSCNYFLDFHDKKRIWTSLFTGFSAAVFTPARIGEYVGRAVDLREQNKLNITAAVFYDKTFTLIWVLVAGLISSTLVWTNAIFTFTVLFTSVSAVSVLIMLFYRGAIYRYLKKRRYVSKLFHLVKSARFPDKTFSAKMFLFSFFFYLCYIIQFMLLLCAFSESINVLKYFLLAGIIIFTKTIIPNFLTGELGIRESAAVFFLSLTGEDPSAGFNAAIFLFIINIAIPSAAGIIPLLRNK